MARHYDLLLGPSFINRLPPSSRPVGDYTHPLWVEVSRHRFHRGQRRQLAVERS